jgi:SAM-dependent methyltransferase
LKEKGKGVLVAARGLGSNVSKVCFNPHPRKSQQGKKPITKTKEGCSNSEWSEFPVEQWRSAVYVNRAYFGQLCSDTKDFIVNIAEHVKLSGRRVSLVEVGCGTGEFIRETSDAFRVAVGVDFNANFIEFCKQEASQEDAARQRYVQGDACALVDLMEKEFPPAEGLLWDDVRVVACVGNTIGIIPQQLKETVYRQMFELAGPNGIVIMAYWNAAWFGDAVQNFYHANPQLCGEFEGESIDLSTATLSTPSGYCTHWTSISEARSVMDSLGAEVISLKAKDKGVLVAARTS